MKDRCQELLAEEIELIGQQYGAKVKSRTCQVLKQVIKWVRVSGHGNVTLSAVDHNFSEKIKTETYIKADAN